VALLHAGDAVQGELYFMKYGGKPEMEFLNRFVFDAYVLGNHEFDRGSKFLAGMLNYCTIPVLGANMDASANKPLARNVKPYILLQYGSERVGVIGLANEETGVLSSPGNVTFSNAAETAARYISELEAQGIDKIVLLTHVGLKRDLELARTVKGVDVIVGGHSHSLLGAPATLSALGLTGEGEYPMQVQGVDGRPVYVVQAWKWGRVLGRLDISFDDSGHVESIKADPELLLADSFLRRKDGGQKVELQGEERTQAVNAVRANGMAEVVPPDSLSEAFLEPYSEGVQAMRTEVIAQADAPLTHIRVPGITESGQRLPGGSLIAPIVCRSMLDKVNSTGEKVDIALQNGGGVRESVPKGKITVGTAYTLLPFSNTLVILKMTGADFAKVLETGVTRGGGAFPYVAGVRYAADMRRPKGERITSIALRQQDGSWSPIDPAATYKVVTNSYLAKGSDGFTLLGQLPDRYDTGFVDAQAFIRYVSALGNVKPPLSTGIKYTPAK